MIREISIKIITDEIAKMCIEANHYLSKDMKEAMERAEQTEESPLGKKFLSQLQENLKIAG